MKDRLSIILINYNNSQFTIDCLKSLNRQNRFDFIVIIIDNNSKLSDYHLLKSNIDNFRYNFKKDLIRSKFNLYYAGGNNKGIKLSTTEYICLLNNDTVVEPDFVDKILLYLDENENVGMLCPKIVFFKKPWLIWYAGSFLNPCSLYFTYHIGLNQKDSKKFNQIKETAYANGAALFVRKEVISKIGLLDEIFFIYVEETDWNYRARKEGYKIIYFPFVKVYHKIEPISKVNKLGYRENPFQIYLYNRNRIIFMLKNFKLKEILIFFMIFQLRITIFELLYSIFKNKRDFFFSNLRSLIIGFVIGLRRRTHRKCKKLIINERRYLLKFNKYRS